MEKVRTILICASIFICLLACTNQNAKFKTELESMYNKQVVVPFDSMRQYNKLIHNSREVLENEYKYKYIVYIDSASCMTCMLNNIPQWGPLVNELKRKVNIQFYFIIQSNLSNAVVKHALSNMENNNSVSIYLDSLKCFESVNPTLPRNQLLNSFLLDKNNRIQLVGNPVRNRDVQKLLLEMIEDRKQ